MTRLYLDTEFNSHGGEFISIALVSADGHEFYAVAGTPADVHPWVAEHVIPFLDADPVGLDAVRDGLAAFLRQFNQIEVVADWPADFEHFFRLLTGATFMTAYCPQMAAIMAQPPKDPEPAVPHNALSDARALLDAWASGGV